MSNPDSYGWGPGSPCEEWVGCVDHKGYGRRTVQGKTRSAHRHAWVQAHGAIREGMMVLHRCDNPPCTNVEHLFLGTAQDNSDDMMAKGRHRTPTGERHGAAKLTPELVLRLRDRHAAGAGYRELAREVGMDHKAIRKAVLGITWQEVTA